MKLSDFVFDLPSGLIAQHPAAERDSSRLMVIDRKRKTISHHRFSDLPSLLKNTDLVVLNDTKVFPARLYGRKKTGSARIEILLLREIEKNYWEVLIRPARRAVPGTCIVFSNANFEALVESGSDSIKRRLRFLGDLDSSWIEREGRVPLPPYIQRPDGEFEVEDRKRYQTVFARSSGSVAAPTAGLHFTPSILETLQHCEITLHVGYGTFKPITVEEIGEHKMDTEFFTIDEVAAVRIQEQLDHQGNVIAVGTTSTRTLEHVIRTQGQIKPCSGWTDLFIYPGFEFKAISGLITNFHLPGSTLILLVSAFAGRELVLEAYNTAIKEGYRFYSYGDAMLII